MTARVKDRPTASQATASGVGSAAGYYVIPNAVPTANPTRSMFAYVGPDAASIPTANRYDPAKDTQLYPASETTDAYVNFNRRFSAGGFLQELRKPRTCGAFFLAHNALPAEPAGRQHADCGDP